MSSFYIMDADDELQAQQLMEAHNYLDGIGARFHRCPIDMPPCPECQDYYDKDSYKFEC